MKKYGCVALVWTLWMSVGAAAQDVAPTEALSAPEQTASFSQESSSLDELLQSTAGVIQAIQDANAQRAATADSSAEGATALTAREAVRLALERNPQALVAQDDVDAAQARVGIARSQLLPRATASITGTVTEYNARKSGGVGSLLSGGLGSMGGLGGFGGGGGGIDPVYQGLGLLVQSQLSKKAAEQAQPQDHLVTEQLTVSQVLFAGGRLLAAVRASEHLAQSQEWQRVAACDALEYDVKRAYYDAILAGALVKVAQDSVRTFERNLADAEHMYEVGLISNFQVLRARTELGARRTDTVAAQNAERLALANVRRLLAMPQETPLALAPVFEWLPHVPSFEDMVAYANERRPELIALRRAAEAAKQEIKRVKGEYFPQVAATADYKNTDGGRQAIPDGWTVSVGAQWEIAAGGRRRAERAQAEAQLAKLEHQYADVSHLVKLDITQSAILIQDAMAKVQSERGNVDLAREGLRLAELRFQEGVGTQSEILDAELALTSAKTKLVQALRDYAVGHAALERATGRSWVRGGDEAFPVPAAGER
ncbi:MAG TPA: TolC family protein [Candidatus Hydrogenedentes bacterium]|nr:TolC family protein [Candidatus Hydrogenedentota bacterium]